MTIVTGTSLAVPVTIVVPLGKTVPEAMSVEVVTSGQLSVALTAKATTAEH